MVPLQIEIDGHGSCQRLRITAEEPETTDDNKQIVDLTFDVTSIRLDLQQRITAEIVLASPIPTSLSSEHEIIQVRIRNVGWSDVNECKFELSSSELRKILGTECLVFEGGHLASGETYIFEFAHPALDKMRLQTLYNERLNQFQIGAEASFEELYNKHLDKLRAPAVSLNRVRQKNHERMTALGRDWKYDPVAVPDDTEEKRARFRDGLATRGKRDSWPTIGDADLTYDLQSSDGSYVHGIVLASSDYLRKGKI